MVKAIRMTRREWWNLKDQLLKEYPPSVILSRDKMKRVLGFTHRSYNDWNTEARHFVHLDFFSEKKHTLFLLKYSDFINEINNG
jgi:hypothetical protein